MYRSTSILFGAALLGGVHAATADPQTNVATASPAPSAPSSLVLYFSPGSATVRQQDVALLDLAGHPIVMIVSGSTDATGSPGLNLRLSQRRADNVLQGLVARGIPIERFQVMAKGETDPVVQTKPGLAEERNRRVEITWR
jgi:outer membrane protein OmpA-like peptidoglycan-associated protein